MAAYPAPARPCANAEGLVRAGAGIRLLPDQVTAEGVGGAAGALPHESGYREAAGTIGREIAAMPAPADLVLVLRKLAGN